MKALLSRTAGGPESLALADIEATAPAEGEVRLAVKACGINYPDVLIIEDRYQYKPPRPFAPGGEVAGIIEAVGPGVSHLAVGARVLGWTGWGGLAEKLTLPAPRCFPIPDVMPFDEAAGFLITYGTAYYALVDRAALRAGETVLVLGASGGVGLAALELAKALGAHVVAAVSSEEKAAFARSRGADATLVYPSGPFDTAEAVKALAGLFKSACGAQGADVIVDPVGGAYCEAALRAVAWEGRHLVIGFPAGIPKLPLNLVLLKSCQVVGVFWGAFEARDPAALARHVSALFALYEKGAIKPAISRRFSLENAAEAIAALANRDALGKLIVLIN